MVNEILGFRPTYQSIVFDIMDPGRKHETWVNTSSFGSALRVEDNLRPIISELEDRELGGYPVRVEPGAYGEGVVKIGPIQRVPGAINPDIEVLARTS